MREQAAGGGEKPNGVRAGWKRQETRYPFSDSFQKLRCDTVRVAGKGQIDFAYQERPTSVLIVPVTDDGHVLLVRQYRYAVDDWLLEVPAGGTQDTGDMPLPEVARKELHEELGAQARELREVGWFYESGALNDAVCHVFLATGVTENAAPERESTERTMETQRLPVAEALRLARNGGIRSGPSTCALLLCEPHLTR